MVRDLKGLNLQLEAAFKAAAAVYKERGFQRRIGFGKIPALINVDLANAWTLPGSPFSCDNIDEQIIPGVQELLKSCRENDHLVVHVTTCYQNTDRDSPHTDMGLWHNKIPIEAVDQKNEKLWAIDSRIAPIEGEHILIKKRASAFHIPTDIYDRYDAIVRKCDCQRRIMQAPERSRVSGMRAVVGL